MQEAVLQNFVIFTGKHLDWSLFLIKLQACNTFQKRLQHKFFPVKISTFLRTSMFVEIQY